MSSPTVSSTERAHTLYLFGVYMTREWHGIASVNQVSIGSPPSLYAPHRIITGLAFL